MVKEGWKYNLKWSYTAVLCMHVVDHYYQINTQSPLVPAIMPRRKVRGQGRATQQAGKGTNESGVFFISSDRSKEEEGAAKGDPEADPSWFIGWSTA